MGEKGIRRGLRYEKKNATKKTVKLKNVSKNQTIKVKFGKK